MEDVGKKATEWITGRAKGDVEYRGENKKWNAPQTNEAKRAKVSNFL